MIITINVSAGFATSSSMLQASGYQILPQNLYSGGGGYESAISSQLPLLGMTHYNNCIAILVIFLVYLHIIIKPTLSDHS